MTSSSLRIYPHPEASVQNTSRIFSWSGVPTGLLPILPTCSTEYLPSQTIRAISFDAGHYSPVDEVQLVLLQIVFERSMVSSGRLGLSDLNGNVGNLKPSKFVELFSGTGYGAFNVLFFTRFDFTISEAREAHNLLWEILFSGWDKTARLDASQLDRALEAIVSHFQLHVSLDDALITNSKPHGILCIPNQEGGGIDDVYLTSSNRLHHQSSMNMNIRAAFHAIIGSFHISEKLPNVSSALPIHLQTIFPGVQTRIECLLNLGVASESCLEKCASSYIGSANLQLARASEDAAKVFAQQHESDQVQSFFRLCVHAFTGDAGTLQGSKGSMESLVRSFIAEDNVLHLLDTISSQLTLIGSAASNSLSIRWPAVAVRRYPPLSKARFWKVWSKYCNKTNILVPDDLRSIDLHRLHSEVIRRGGEPVVSQIQQWPDIVVALGLWSSQTDVLANLPSIAQHVRDAYVHSMQSFDKLYIKSVDYGCALKRKIKTLDDSPVPDISTYPPILKDRLYADRPKCGSKNGVKTRETPCQPVLVDGIFSSIPPCYMSNSLGLPAGHNVMLLPSDNSKVTIPATLNVQGALELQFFVKLH
ncbi:hypothetical protein DL96DRAFT_911596 [Flagelloscypha sp. PMI_526]|nr:hypothetical protein DL96DRAFT_911596 [Flagelloscypha sp. PMI_526]